MRVILINFNAVLMSMCNIYYMYRVYNEGYDELIILYVSERVYFY